MDLALNEYLCKKLYLISIIICLTPSIYSDTKLNTKLN